MSIIQAWGELNITYTFFYMLLAHIPSSVTVTIEPQPVTPWSHARSTSASLPAWAAYSGILPVFNYIYKKMPQVIILEQMTKQSINTY